MYWPHRHPAAAGPGGPADRESWSEQVAVRLQQAPLRLTRWPVADYEEALQPVPTAGLPASAAIWAVPVRRLVGLQASARLEVVLPLLPAGWQVTARDSEFWLQTPDEVAEPLADAVASAVEEDELVGRIVAELQADGEPAVAEPDFGQLTQLVRVERCTLALTACGVEATLNVCYFAER